MTRESERLKDAREGKAPWKKWDGQARSRAYRWTGTVRGGGR